jgi:hypothetical protein
LNSKKLTYKAKLNNKPKAGKITLVRIFDSSYCPDEEIAEHCKRTVDYTCVATEDKIALFKLKGAGFITNSDGTITSVCELKIIDAHAFIEITTGTVEKKTIDLLICLLDLRSIDVAHILTREVGIQEFENYKPKPLTARLKIQDANNRSITAILDVDELHYIGSLKSPSLVKEYTVKSCPWCKHRIEKGRYRP